MKYAQAKKLIDNEELEAAYLLRLIATFEAMKWYASDLATSRKKANKLISSGIEFLEFVGVQNLISDWDEIKVQK